MAKKTWRNLSQSKYVARTYKKNKSYYMNLKLIIKDKKAYNYYFIFKVHVGFRFTHFDLSLVQDTFLRGMILGKGSTSWTRVCTRTAAGGLNYQSASTSRTKTDSVRGALKKITFSVSENVLCLGSVYQGNQGRISKSLITRGGGQIR